MKSLLSFGCGNMAQAIVEGMNKSSKELEYFLYTPSNTRAIELAKVVSGTHVADLSKIPECDFYMLSCKPQQFEELAKSIKGKLKPSATIISILAGTTTETISKSLGVSKVLRVMPNTPSLVGAGVNAFYFTDEVENEERHFLTDIFSGFSKVFTFEKEEEIDLITGFSGSGPAYIFEFSRILTEKMVSMGIARDIATEMIKWTFYGSSKLQLESSDSSEELRNKVTSKNGVTYEALEVFKGEGLEKIVDMAIDAAYNRAVELSK
ncbi:pyrroline-5-carboxylate reductase [Halobacteriovorax marinus]|uniref:pyrroline-5-carboxylate reductase n=1 Tax=Halobacteriovorax marinus TaxID=97084 RepID=UPI003A93C606